MIKNQSIYSLTKEQNFLLLCYAIDYSSELYYILFLKGNRRKHANMKKENKHKEQMNKFKNYECDGQLCFVDIEMNIAEELKKNHEQQSA